MVQNNDVLKQSMEQMTDEEKDKFIRNVGATGNMNEAVGCSLYRFLNEVDTNKSSIGNIETSGLRKSEDSLRVVGTHYYSGGAPVSILSRKNIGIEISRKLCNYGSYTGQQLLRDFMEKYNLEEATKYMKQICDIESNKLTITVFKPGMKCKVYVGENKGKARCSEAETSVKELMETEGLDDKEIDNLLLDKILEGCMDDVPNLDMADSDYDEESDIDIDIDIDTGSNTGSETGKKYQPNRNKSKMCKYVNSNAVGSGQERTLYIESVRWEVNPETGRIESKIVTTEFDGVPGKRVIAGIEEYGITFLLTVIEGNNTSHKINEKVRKFIRVSRFGYIKPIKIATDTYNKNFCIDNCFMYEEHGDEVKVIGFWDSNNKLIMLNSEYNNKLARYADLKEALRFIAQHRRFIAPYSLSEFNMVNAK